MSKQEHFLLRLAVCVIAAVGIVAVMTFDSRNSNAPIVQEVPRRGEWRFKTCFLGGFENTKMIFGESELVTPDGNVVREQLLYAYASQCYIDTLTLPEKSMQWELQGPVGLAMGKWRLYYNPGHPNRRGHPSGPIHNTT